MEEHMVIADLNAKIVVQIHIGLVAPQPISQVQLVCSELQIYKRQKMLSYVVKEKETKQIINWHLVLHQRKQGKIVKLKSKHLLMAQLSMLPVMVAPMVVVVIVVVVVVAVAAAVKNYT